MHNVSCLQKGRGVVMHIPENYLSPSSCGILDVAMVAVLSIAIKKTRQSLSRERMPLLGIAAAFSFLAMMFNIPLPGGTTGHAVCGTLIAILFGPWPAVIAITIALFIQAFFFGDGGIIALGANCFNMAFVLPFVGYGIYWIFSRIFKGLRGELIGAAIGSYVAINIAALLAAIEFGIQPLLFHDAVGNALYAPYPLTVTIPSMLAGHLGIWGIAEAIFTVGILAFLRKVAPDFKKNKNEIDTPEATFKSLRPVIILIAALVICVPLGLLAEGDAFGEWSVEDLSATIGYTPLGMGNSWEWSAFFPDYTIAPLPEWVAYIVSAVIGVALLIIIFRLLALVMKPKINFDSANSKAKSSNLDEYTYEIDD